MTPKSVSYKRKKVKHRLSQRPSAVRLKLFGSIKHNPDDDKLYQLLLFLRFLTSNKTLSCIQSCSLLFNHIHFIEPYLVFCRLFLELALSMPFLLSFSLLGPMNSNNNYISLHLHLESGEKVSYNVNIYFPLPKHGRCGNLVS